MYFIPAFMVAVTLIRTLGAKIVLYTVLLPFRRFCAVRARRKREI